MMLKTDTCHQLIILCGNGLFAATEITVYTAIESEQLQAYKQAFEAKYPDIKIKWVKRFNGDYHR